MARRRSKQHKAAISLAQRRREQAVKRLHLEVSARQQALMVQRALDAKLQQKERAAQEALAEAVAARQRLEQVEGER